MACHICDIIQNRKKVLYEDEKVAAFLSERPAMLGHVVIASKEHYTIVEQVPDYITGHAFVVANKISIIIFEVLKAQGTNVIVTNGVVAGQKSPHFLINVIPRFQNDNINLKWQPKQLTEEEMSTAELQIKEQTKNIGGFEKEAAEAVEIKEIPKEVIAEKEGKENYLLKQIKRIP